jgi:hypothetical protein
MHVIRDVLVGRDSRNHQADGRLGEEEEPLRMDARYQECVSGQSQPRPSSRWTTGRRGGTAEDGCTLLGLYWWEEPLRTDTRYQKCVGGQRQMEGNETAQNNKQDALVGPPHLVWPSTDLGLL